MFYKRVHVHSSHEKAIYDSVDCRNMVLGNIT